MITLKAGGVGTGGTGHKARVFRPFTYLPIYLYLYGDLAMDFQHRAGAKTGGGGVASSSESSRDRKERLRKLALETIDLAKVGAHLFGNCTNYKFFKISTVGSLFYEKPPWNL